MNSILEQLYFGNMRPEEIIRPKDPEYRSLNQKISSSMEYFKKNLSEHEFKLLEDLMDSSGQSGSMHSTEAFVQGVRIGALMMVEVFMGEEGFV